MGKDPKKKKEFDAELRREQELQVQRYNAKRSDSLLSYEEAYARRFSLSIDWENENIPVPSFLGHREMLDFPLDGLSLSSSLLQPMLYMADKYSDGPGVRSK